MRSDSRFDLTSKKGERILPRKPSCDDRAPEIGDDLKNVPDFVTRKMSDWSYECEWRLLAMAADAPEENPSGVFLFPFDKSAAREVTFGVNATDDFVKQTIIQMRESGLASTFLKAARNAEAYTLERTEMGGA